MSLFDEAVVADSDGHIEFAADLYEACIRLEGQCPEAFANLAVLYWVCGDTGFQGAEKLNIAFIKRAGNRYGEVLQAGLEKYPEGVELRFWRRYIDEVEGAGAGFFEACKQLLDISGSIPVPAFYLFVQTDGREYEDQVDRLLSYCERSPNTKCRYISSVVSGVLKRRRFIK